MFKSDFWKITTAGMIIQRQAQMTRSEGDLQPSLSTKAVFPIVKLAEIYPVASNFTPKGLRYEFQNVDFFCYKDIHTRRSIAMVRFSGFGRCSYSTPWKI